MELYSYSVYVTCYLLPAIFQFHGMTSNMIFSLKGNKLCWVGKFTFILRNDKFVGFTTWSWKNFFYCISLSFFWLPWNCTSVHTFPTLCESCKKFGLPTMSCRKNFVSYLHMVSSIDSAFQTSEFETVF